MTCLVGLVRALLLTVLPAPKETFSTKPHLPARPALLKVGTRSRLPIILNVDNVSVFVRPALMERLVKPVFLVSIKIPSNTVWIVKKRDG